MPGTDSELPKFSLGRQVRAGLAALLALLVILTAVAILIVTNLSDEETSLNDNVPYAHAVAAAALDAKGVANDQRGFLLSGDTTYLREADQRVADARRAFATAEQAATTVAQRQSIAASKAGFERWWSVTEAQFRLYLSGDAQAAVQASLGQGRTLRKEYEAALEHSESLGQSSLQSGRAGVSGAVTRSVTILLVCLAAALVTGAVIASWLIRQISAPLFRLATFLTSQPQ